MPSFEVLSCGVRRHLSQFVALGIMNGFPFVCPIRLWHAMKPALLILSKHESPTDRDAAMDQEIIAGCRAERFDCVTIPPLYHLAESSTVWASLADRVCDGKHKEVVLLVRLHPRPARWLLARHGIKIEESRVLDLRTFNDAASVLAAVNNAVGSRKAGRAAASNIESLRAPTRDRWYPIVDFSRCIECHHCLQFCLFGVYELNADGKLSVRNPDACKPGCPACSRICPQSAIMFPLHEKDAGIAGAPGEWVQPDPAAKRMYYARTQQPCPVCGRKPERKPHASGSGDSLCPECGRPMPKNTLPANAPTPDADRPAFDDLDLLVDQLDEAMRRRG